MNPAVLPALAALAGSATGGLTSFASTWLTLRRQGRASRLSRERAKRQKLYKQFIDEASKLYADALVHEKAEAVVRMIVATYSAPNKTFPEVRKLIDSHAIDPLRNFSEACRADLQAL